MAEFLASPTWLDSQNLVPNGTLLQQSNELYNVLLRASGWAQRIAQQPLHARTGFVQDRAPVDRWGNLYLVPNAFPIRQVNAMAWGYSFQDLNVLNTPSAQTWIEKQQTIIFQLSPSSSPGLTNFQFGRVQPRATDVFVEYSYVAGYCNTTLSQAATAGASQIFLTDPTGLQPAVTGGLLGTIPGSVARIWDPANPADTTGGEEAIQVSPSWVAGTNPVLLVNPLVNNHAAGAAVSELPPEVHQAVTALTVGLLCREDVSDDEPYGGTPFGPTVRKSKRGGKAGGLIDHAEGILLRYRPRMY